MLRHPQNSGLQMDQLTRLYIPPFFIENLKIWQGDDLVRDDGWRDRDLGRSEHPFQLQAQWRRRSFASRPSIPARTYSGTNGRIEKSML